MSNFFLQTKKFEKTQKRRLYLIGPKSIRFCLTNSRPNSLLIVWKIDFLIEWKKQTDKIFLSLNRLLPKNMCFLSVPKLVYIGSGYQRNAKSSRFTPHKLRVWFSLDKKEWQNSYSHRRYFNLLSRYFFIAYVFARVEVVIISMYICAKYNRNILQV